ncbi:MAG TPA: glycoside hydrolase family 15 protein [Candidatus Paceibacterota bacterium]|jgi:GH15 family glucan-1,4-alpha-glucosidase|nr:glycoside hydrolase family 15 protein [Candidatus Paceibacterota bacterium]
MSRSIVLSNGQLAVALDSRGAVRDVYFPHVGQEDHVRGRYIHRVGVWVDGRLSWLSDDAWQISVLCADEALQSAITARHEGLGVELTFTDMVYSDRPVFIRRVAVRNLGQKRAIKLYFGHEYEIYKSHGSDTAYFDPISHSVIHYKGRRVFLMNATLDDEPFQDFACGRMNFQGKEGTHKDAEDGQLSKNPIEHGPADSVIGVYGEYAADQVKVAHYWIAAAQFIQEAQELNSYILKKSAEYLVRGADSLWQEWLGQRDFADLADEHAGLFKRSLMYLRAHVDQDGGIVASLDSDVLQFALDTYAYIWPRDASYVAQVLIRSGDPVIAKRFLEFCRHTITQNGYFLHKYLPDMSLGSSWHPWWQDGEMQLPIQEDETALVVLTALQEYEATHDIEWLETIYAPVIERAANFMLEYRDPATGLPQPSYDLWERKRGVITFTCSAVSAALSAAAELSKAVGKSENEKKYHAAANEIREAIAAKLWDEKNGYFVNMLENTKNGIVYDRTLDASSAYGIFAFGILPVDDERLERAWSATAKRLSEGISAGGLARFESDDYYRVPGPSQGNPWIVTTLWYAEYLIARAKKRADLDRVREMFDWVVRHAQASGVLSEQQHPQSGVQISVAPLAWSHAAYVNAVLLYLEKLKELPPI